jgi:hypothetical protein
MKIQSFSEDIKLKTDNLFVAVGTTARPDVIPPRYCKYALSHSAAFDPPVSVYQ